jgi:hypothetical protein
MDARKFVADDCQAVLLIGDEQDDWKGTKEE